MKKFIIGMVLESVFDMLVLSLGKIAMRSTSSIDNEMVGVIADNRDEIIADIKRRL